MYVPDPPSRTARRFPRFSTVGEELAMASDLTVKIDGQRAGEPAIGSRCSIPCDLRPSGTAGTGEPLRSCAVRSPPDIEARGVRIGIESGPPLRRLVHRGGRGPRFPVRAPRSARRLSRGKSQYALDLRVDSRSFATDSAAPSLLLVTSTKTLSPTFIPEARYSL